MQYCSYWRFSGLPLSLPGLTFCHPERSLIILFIFFFLGGEGRGGSLLWGIIRYWNLSHCEFKIQVIIFLLSYKENCKAYPEMSACYGTTVVSRRYLVHYFHLKRMVTAEICASRQFNGSLFTVSDQVFDSCKMFTTMTKAQTLNMSEMMMRLMRLMDQKLSCLLVGREFQQHPQCLRWMRWEWPPSYSSGPARWEMGLQAVGYAIPPPPTPLPHLVTFYKHLQNFQYNFVCPFLFSFNR